jgi:RNase H-fold protein (predicted Holliday junction resolvase)
LNYKQRSERAIEKFKGKLLKLYDYKLKIIHEGLPTDKVDREIKELESHILETQQYMWS